jgi:hypothetical protein
LAVAGRRWEQEKIDAKSHLELQASLGIEQDPLANVIRFRNPTLPAFLDSVVLRGLKAGAGSVDLSVHRHGDDKIFPCLSGSHIHPPVLVFFHVLDAIV